MFIKAKEILKDITETLTENWDDTLTGFRVVLSSLLSNDITPQQAAKQLNNPDNRKDVLQMLDAAIKKFEGSPQAVNIKKVKDLLK